MPKPAFPSFKRARVLLHSILSSDKGNGVPPVRWTRGAVSFVNDLAGRPLCSAEELSRREGVLAEAEAQVRSRKGHADPGSHKQTGTAAAAHKKPRGEAAPVVVYTTDQDTRTGKKIEDILKARDVAYVINDVTDDESSRSWALTQAKKTEFPLVFIAGEPVGDVHDLMELDVQGDLVKKVFG